MKRKNSLFFNGSVTIVDVMRWGVLLYVFLLPLQTRWIFFEPHVAVGAWEWGRGSLYATELLLLSLFVFFCVHRLYTWSGKRLVVGDQGLLVRNQAFYLAPLESIALALLFLGGFSVFFSIAPMLSLHVFWKLADAVGLFFFVRHLRISAASIARVVVVSAGAQAVVAIMQFGAQQITANKWLGIAAQDPSVLGTAVVQVGDARWLRVFGTLPHPNMLAAWLLLGILLAVYLLSVAREKPFPRAQQDVFCYWFFSIGALFALVAMSTALVLTFSRSALLSLGIFALVIIVQSIARKKIQRRVVGALAFIFLSVAFTAVNVLPLITTRASVQTRLEQRSLVEREEGVAKAAGVIRRHLIIGTGIGAYTAVQYGDNAALQGWEYQPVHNVWLLLAAELGVVGFVVGLLLLAELFARVLAGFRASSSGRYLLIATSFCIVLLGFFDHFLWTSYFGITIFFLAFCLDDVG